MIVSVPSDSFSSEYVFSCLETVDPSDLKARMNTDGTPKLTSDGKQTFATPLNVLHWDGEKSTGVVRNASVNVATPCAIEFGQIYRPVGTVRVVHYLTADKRLSVSLTCDDIEPASNFLSALVGS